MKGKKEPDESIAKKPRRRRAAEPLEVRLTLRYRFGDAAAEAVTVMDDRAIPMIDNVFKNRDRILRVLATTMVRAGVSQPKVLKEMIPVIGLLTGRKPSSKQKK